MKADTNFPERLRELIEDLGLTQTAFAKQIDIELQKLKDVLRGKVRPPIGLIQRVVEVTGVEADWLLLGRAGDPGELNPAERSLLDDYRSLPSTDRAFVNRLVELLARDDFERRNFMQPLA